MSDRPAEEFTLADWESVGLKLLVFTRYWARTHYRWLPGRPLPQGKSPEDIACDVYAAFANGTRTLNEKTPLMAQLKGAVRSVLWNLHNSKDAVLTTSLSAEEFEALADSNNPAANVEQADFAAEFWRLLYEDVQVKRSADLRKFANAVEAGAESVDAICTATTFSVAQVYELRRRLKQVAERIFQKLNDEQGAPHEPKQAQAKSSGTAA